MIRIQRQNDRIATIYLDNLTISVNEFKEIPIKMTVLPGYEIKVSREGDCLCITPSKIAIPETMNAEQWNARYPVGTEVIYYPVIDGNKEIPTKTRSRAWLLKNGEPVVQIDGIAGGVTLRAIRPCK